MEFNEDQINTQDDQNYNDDSDIDNKNKVRLVIDEISNATISESTYKSFYNKIESNNRIIDSMVETQINKFKIQRQKRKSLLNQPGYRESIQEGLTPKDFTEVLMDMIYTLQELNSWTITQNKIYSSFFQKTSDIMDAVEALKVKSKALQEFKEISQQQLDAMKSMNEIATSSFLSHINNMSKEQASERKVIVNEFKSEIKTFTKDLLGTFSNLSKHIISKVDNSKNDDFSNNQIQQPINYQQQHHNYQYQQQPYYSNQQINNNQQQYEKSENIINKQKNIDQVKKNTINKKQEEINIEEEFDIDAELDKFD